MNAWKEQGVHRNAFNKGKMTGPFTRWRNPEFLVIKLLLEMNRQKAGINRKRDAAGFKNYLQLGHKAANLYQMPTAILGPFEVGQHHITQSRPFQIFPFIRQKAGFTDKFFREPVHQDKFPSG